MYLLRTSKIISGLLLTAAAFALPGTFPALAASPLVLSGPSPLLGCNVSGEAGTNYLDGVVEPWVDVNPANPSHMIAGWQQDRWSNGGARGLVSAYSVDGGQRWQRVVVPSINKCSGGKGDFAYDRSSDPWIAISPNGTAYFLSLSVRTAGPDRGTNAILVSRSTTGGASWGNPVVLRQDTDIRIFNDKPAISADPKDSRYVYAVWDQLFDYSGVDGEVDEPAGSGQRLPDAAAFARRHLRALSAGGASGVKAVDGIEFVGPTYFARTIDGGQTWEPAKVIYDAGANAQSFANQVVVLGDGSVLVFYTEIFADGSTKIRFIKSTNHGQTFSLPADAAVSIQTMSGTRTPDRLDAVRDGSYNFDVAVDRTRGRIYLVWQDGRQGGVDRVFFSMSSDGGTSWSAPVNINKTPKNSNALRTQAFLPSIEVSEDSRVYVTYYDFRRDPARSNTVEMSDYWAISCRPASDCRKATAWGYETRLTPRSFNLMNAPQDDAGAYFLGDYQGLVKQGISVRPVFVIPNSPGITSTVTSVIR